MNLIRINTSPWALVIAAFSFFALGCKSTIKTSTAGRAVKTKIEKEASLPKEGEKFKGLETEESMKQNARMALKIMKENAPKVKLNEYFDAIANSDNTVSANSSINKALAMFTSAETPVLIVISEEGGMKHYDRPTTIKAYFDYLKTEKKNMDDIKNLKIDYSGKISEVELKKNN